MERKTFLKKEAIAYGWKTMKEHFWFFLAIFLLVWIVALLPDMVSDIVKGDSPLFAFAIDLATVVVNILLGLGIVKISILFASGERGTWNDLFGQIHLFFKYLGGAILYALIVIGGLLLLIVPGIIWAIQFGLYQYCIVDKGYGPLDALAASSRLTRGVRWQLFLFGIVLGLINVLGALTIIGIFVTVPTTMVASAWVYRKLDTIESAKV